MKHKLEVDLQELEIALTWRSTASHSYLDLETGAVVTIDDQSRQTLESIYKELAKRGVRERDVPLAKQLEQFEFLRERFKGDLLVADRVERELGSRYISIEPAGADQDSEDAKAFVLTIDDAVLQDHLMQAIKAGGALRRFKDLVYSDPEIHEQWYAFQGARTRQRVLVWLQEHNIEPVAP
ncbi:MAG: hypothetical protein JXA89_18810 [Anaerolineae bacterium]|nr:hypothetical protein [Anaerolineae bacterium]